MNRTTQKRRVEWAEACGRLMLLSLIRARHSKSLVAAPRHSKSLVAACLFLFLLSATTWQRPNFGAIDEGATATKRVSRVTPGGLSDLRFFHYRPKPRMFGYFFEADGSLVGSRSIRPLRESAHNSAREVQSLGDGPREYTPSSTDHGEGCVDQHEWQSASYPTCNALHETSFNTFPQAARTTEDEVVFVARGAYRRVFLVRQWDGTPLALKTVKRKSSEFRPKMYEKHRIDAMAMERLTSSPYVVDVFGFCGNSGLFEFSDEGNLSDRVDEGDIPKLDKLKLAHRAAAALADAHMLDDEGRATLAHADLAIRQYVSIGGEYKLNDFNKSHFLKVNPKTKEVCGFEVRHKKFNSANRSPEEYALEHQTDKADVFSLGNVIYILLVGHKPFDGTDKEIAHRKLVAGERAAIDAEVYPRDDPVYDAMITAIERCWIHDPRERATSREVASYLRSRLDKIAK